MTGLTPLAQAAQYYDQTYMTTTTTVDTSSGAFFLVILLSLLFLIVNYVVYSYFLGRVFKKAGVAGWKAWIPVYSTWITLELGGQKGFWAVLLLVPFVNIAASVFLYIAMYQIGVNFGKDGVFVLLAIFLTLVWVIWLALDKSTWQPAGSIATQASPAATPPPPVM